MPKIVRRESNATSKFYTVMCDTKCLQEMGGSAIELTLKSGDQVQRVSMDGIVNGQILYGFQRIGGPVNGSSAYVYVAPAQVNQNFRLR